MCGISGIVSFRARPPDKASIRRMMAKMKHRGPNDEGLFLENDIGLGFVRLSVLDLSRAGNQPMYSHDRRFVIVFNGEIYNYVELREQLKHKYAFATRTDTEVILAAYQEWGDACLDAFNGMFALAIYDRRTKTLFAARDRFGIKPFYYHQTNERLIFASELQSILAVAGDATALGDQAMFDFLAFNRTDHTRRTLYRDIEKLPHGHSLTIERDRVDTARWYDLRSVNAQPLASPDEYLGLLTDSVRLRLRSDVPVGVCLSGGLDSSAITSIVLGTFQKRDLHTFSAVYSPGDTGDESEFIGLYNGSVENMHFASPNADTFFSDKERFVRAHGEPFPDASVYSQFKVFELAAEHVVVTLDGQGADEQLGGYHYFYGYYFKELMRRLRLAKLMSEVAHYWLIQRSFFGLLASGYLMLPGGLQARTRTRDTSCIHADFYDLYARNNEVTARLYASRTLNDALFDHFEYKLEHLLKWADCNSMHFSLESRVPFLDHRLVEQVLASPPETKIQRGWTKAIHRESMRGIVPEAIRTRRDKIGFGNPQAEWYRTPKFADYVRDILGSSGFQQLGFFDVPRSRAMFDDHLARKADHSSLIWKWINLSIWNDLNASASSTS